MPVKAKSDPEPPLAYELRPERPVTRRQFRFLLALVVLNLLVSIEYAYAPGVSTFIKEQWAEHKRRAAIEGPELFRFYAGQPDPADASHFTIGYDLDGRRGAIDGRLKDNGRVEFKPDTGAVINDRWYPPGE
jgi:hypothetical protein